MIMHLPHHLWNDQFSFFINGSHRFGHQESLIRAVRTQDQSVFALIAQNKY